MRSQTIATELVDDRVWRAAPVDSSGWLTSRPAHSSVLRPGAEAVDDAAAGAPPIPRRRDDRGSVGRSERRAARARRLRRRARTQRATIAVAESQAVLPAGDAEPEIVVEPAATPVVGYRMGRWTRLALTLTVLAAAVVVTVSLVGGSAPTALVDVTVGPGDTLWSIAQDASPDRDPRAVIDEIRQLNDVPTDMLPIGVVLRVPAASD